MTLAEVYDLHCEVAGRGPERIIMFFKENVHKAAEKDPSSTASPPALVPCSALPSVPPMPLCYCAPV